MLLSSFHNSTSLPLPSLTPPSHYLSSTFSLPIKMSSHSLPPLPQHRIVLGCGAIGLDFLAAVASYPNPDDKIRSTSLKIQGGGNTGNALTAAARLGLNPRIISKVADDPQGRGIIEELEADGVDTSFLILGCGAIGLDFLAAVASYPNPDDKIRSTSLKVQGGGNTGNALTAAARLGLNPRIISKVADDPQGRGIIEELEADGVDTSFLIVSEKGNSPFTYVIVDNQTKTRTCIHTPGDPPMEAEELSDSNLSAALDGTRLVYLDGRLPDTALKIALEATRKNIPILIDVERLREGLDDLLPLASYAVCSAKFPQAWTKAPSVPSALVSMLLGLPQLKFVIVTLGEDGCILLERSEKEALASEETDVDNLLELLMQQKDGSVAVPTCVSSSISRIRANGVGSLSGRLFLGTAEKIPPSELVDTTGAGDAFIGAALYAICANMPPEKMLPFAAQVAAAGCRALGARTGLPRRDDPRLSSLLC